MSPENDKQHRSAPCLLVCRLLTLPQYLIPQHSISLLMYRLTRSRRRWFKNLFIRIFNALFKVDMNEAADADPTVYASFNAFFTRALRAGVRPVAAGDQVVTSPVDGTVSQLGPVRQGRIIQAKGRDYTVQALLGDAVLAERFEGGQFATIYLSPRDYHRIHMPLNGRLRTMRYIPGKLFSVNPRTTRAVSALFARNERVVTVFDTEHGPMALVLVGAIFVGSIETVWAGQITPPYGGEIREWHYEDDSAIALHKAQEMGRFNMGSTVVLLLPPGMRELDASWQPESPILLGQAMN